MENSAEAPGPSFKKHIKDEALHLHPRPELLAKAGFFKHIVAMTVKTLKAPIALIVFTEEEYVKRYAAELGINNSIKEGLNSSAIMPDEVPFLAVDSGHSLFLLAEPMAARAQGFGFYAAAPLIASGGRPLGTLCVVGVKSREFSENDQCLLEELAAVAVHELEERWIL